MHRAEYAKHSINRIPYQDFPINRRLYMPIWRWEEGGEVESAGNINNNTAVLLNYIVKKQNNVL